MRETKDGLGGNHLDVAHIRWLRYYAGWSCVVGNCHPDCGVQYEKIETPDFGSSVTRMRKTITWKAPVRQRPCRAGALSKETGRKQGEVHSFLGCVMPKERVIQERPSCMRFAEECVKLIRKIWFREVLDSSNSKDIIADSTHSVKR